MAQCSRATLATAEAQRDLRAASGAAVDLSRAYECLSKTHSTRGAARAYEELLRVTSVPMDDATSAMVKRAKVAIRDVALLRCACEADPLDKEAYFEVLTAAFGALLDSVPNLRSQLKLAYHKVINSHPSKNQLETDKRGSQRAARRRNTSRIPRQRIASASPAAGSAEQHHSACCASAFSTSASSGLATSSAAINHEFSATMQHQSSCCASAEVEETRSGQLARHALSSNPGGSSIVPESTLSLPNRVVGALRAVSAQRAGIATAASASPAATALAPLATVPSPRRVVVDTNRLLNITVLGCSNLLLHPIPPMFWGDSPVDKAIWKLLHIYQCAHAPNMHLANKPQRLLSITKSVMADVVVMNGKRYKFTNAVKLLLNTRAVRSIL